jgi:hypothetical protein
MICERAAEKPFDSSSCACYVAGVNGILNLLLADALLLTGTAVGF